MKGERRKGITSIEDLVLRLREDTDRSETLSRRRFGRRRSEGSERWSPQDESRIIVRGD